VVRPIAMMIISFQTNDPNVFMVLIGLSVIIACVLGACDFITKCLFAFLSETI
jgi:hypothetical protein